MDCAISIGAISKKRKVVFINERIRLSNENTIKFFIPDHCTQTFRFMIFDKNEPKLLAIIDWEICTTGHPIADLASLIMQWEQKAGRISRGLQGVERGSLGIPSDEDFIKEYCEFRNIQYIKDFNFYLAFCFFRMACVIQGVKKRALTGIAANPERSNRETLSVPNLAARAPVTC